VAAAKNAEGLQYVNLPLGRLPQLSSGGANSGHYVYERIAGDDLTRAIFERKSNRIVYNVASACEMLLQVAQGGDVETSDVFRGARPWRSAIWSAFSGPLL